MLLLAGMVRLPLVPRSLPYLGYVDEGHVLHHVSALLRSGGWDPGWYGYPSLTLYLIAGCFRVLDWIARAAGGHGHLAGLSTGADFYDFVTPPSLILTGRFVVLVASLAIVLLGMALARRVAGERAALTAGVFLALCPALVQRSSVVIVDTVAVALVLAALVAVLRMLPDASGGPLPARTLPWALAAGALSGLAAAAKYPAGAVLLAVLTTVALLEAPVAARLRLGLASVAGALAGAFVGMPALVLKPRAVLDALQEQARLYANPALMSPGTGAPPSLPRQTFERYELGLVLPVAGAIGLALLLAHRGTRRLAAPWLVFAVALLVPTLAFPFQPFRNVLPLVPLLVVASAAACDAASDAWRPGRALLPFLVVASFVPGLLVVARVRGARDSRAVLLERLAPMVRPGARVLVMHELAILPSELRRLEADVSVLPLEELAGRVASGGGDLVVVGRMDPAAGVPAAGEAVLSSLSEKLRIGSIPTPSSPFLWRTNDELLIVAVPPGATPSR